MNPRPRKRSPDEYLLGERAGLDRDSGLRGLLFLLSSLAVARRSDGGLRVVDHLWTANRRIAGHRSQRAGLLRGRLDDDPPFVLSRLEYVIL